jgi:hypothetical protein
MERLTQKAVRHADAAEMTLLSQALELSGQGMIVLTKNGRVLLISPRARAWLAEYFGASPSRQTNRLPDSLRHWRKHQEAQLGGNDGVPPPPRRSCPNGKGSASWCGTSAMRRRATCSWRSSQRRYRPRPSHLWA